MKRRILLVVACLSAMGIIATGTLFSREKAKIAPATTVQTLQYPRQKKPDPPGTIDGAKNPEMISDKVAYSILFRLIANHNTDVGRHRIRAYLKQAGLNGGDIDALIAAANEFQNQVGVLDTQAKQIKDSKWPNPSPTVMADLTLLQKQKEAIVTEISASLPTRLTLTGLNSIRQHVSTHMKRRIKLHSGPDHPPGGPGWKPHDMNGH